MTWFRVVPDAEVPALVPEWDDLAARAGSWFNAPHWAMTAHRTLGGGRPLLVEARRDDRLVGVLPLQVRRRAGVDVTQFLGAGPGDYGSVPVTPDAGPEQAQEVVDGLLDTATHTVDALLDLHQLSEAEPSGARVLDWARSRGRAARVLVQSVTLRTEFDAVAGAGAGGSRKSRQTRNRTLRTLGARGRVEVVEELLPHPSEAAVAALAAECAAVDDAHPDAEHRNRPWTGRNGSFLREFLRCAPVGSRWFTGLRLDGRLMAYTLELVAPATVGGYLSSYRREVADAGVGSLLSWEVRRRALAHGAATFDLLQGLEPYKVSLATSRHVSHRVLIAPGRSGLLARGVGATFAWRQELRPLVLKFRS